jgi:nitrite reductase/ring-hydroxylating ferredoxin subunit
MPKIDLKLEDIPFDSPFRVESNGSRLVLFRTNGEIRAFIDRCPHAHWPLSDGELKGSVLQCIGHGWEFDIHTGRCLTVPVCSLNPLPTIIDTNTLRIEWD